MDDADDRRSRRRRVIAGSLAATLAALAGPSRLAAAAALVTPRQSLGPFYPPDWEGDADWDLVRVAGAAARAIGQVTHIAGRVTDAAGAPLAGAAVEIWQCDAKGRYRHPRDAARGVARDTGFQGRGRTVTGADGGYRFRTIRPVPYPGRTPHIHFRIAAPGRPELVTQMYVDGEPGNEGDMLFRHIDPARRAALLVRLAPADAVEPGALAGRFDIVLG